MATVLGLQLAFAGERLQYHEIVTDKDGNIVPWYSPDPATAYDFCIRRVWEFWKNMKPCPNGVKYYLQHQVWQDPGEDPRGLGGDQLAMAMSSWNLLYDYLGDPSVVENMELIADYAIDHGFSKANAAWPNLFYPYNTELHSGQYDGDMRAGKGVLQPDKAGSLGAELLTLYKITGNERYLKTALAIADTLSRKVTPGDEGHSPWPYRVNAATGQVAAPYTSNWTGTLRLFDDLIRLKRGHEAAYQKAFDLASDWLKKYPLRLNKWGPFFEDVGEWSNTEINADTLAWYILENPEWDTNWREDSERILTFTQSQFENGNWLRHGVWVINEQTAYRVPGNSHTSRHASVQLIFAEKAGEPATKWEAIRQLNWATYMVAEDGRNRYYRDDVWLTDGYGDYVRHYLRAMAAAPELAPQDQSHLLRSTSVVKNIAYTADSVTYSTFDSSSRELLRVAFTPREVAAGQSKLKRLDNVPDLAREEGYTFNAPGDVPGVLRIRHDRAGNVTITGGK